MYFIFLTIFLAKKFAKMRPISSAHLSTYTDLKTMEQFFKMESDNPEFYYNLSIVPDLVEIGQK